MDQFDLGRLDREARLDLQVDVYRTDIYAPLFLILQDYPKEPIITCILEVRQNFHLITFFEHDFFGLCRCALIVPGLQDSRGPVRYYRAGMTETKFGEAVNLMQVLNWTRLLHERQILHINHLMAKHTRC